VDRGEGRQQDPGRRPLLIISGEKDNTAPWSIASASCKKQERNDGVTEIEEIPNRGHALHDRQRLARGRRQGPRLREALYAGRRARAECGKHEHAGMAGNRA
jgi:pimeloyl-ACP methyl ester carboxylesterase